MRRENGITMIALIITIVVMVILAGAAISMVVGDDAVVTKAKKGVSENNLAQAQEEVEAAWGDLEMGFWMETSTTKRSDYFTAEKLEESLGGKGTISEDDYNYVPGGTTTGIYVKDGVEYEFALDTSSHTDVTADSFGTTDTGYGEGAVVVPDTVEVAALTLSQTSFPSTCGDLTITADLTKSNPDQELTLKFKFNQRYGTYGETKIYMGEEFDEVITTTLSSTSITRTLDYPNYFGRRSVELEVLDTSGNVIATYDEVWFSIACLPADTLVSVVVEEEDENGKKTKKLKKKKIKDLTYDDDLLVWDFDKGCLAITKPLWLMKKQETEEYNLLKFSDGTELKTVRQHRIFNKELGKFTYPMSEETPVGTTTFKEDGTEVRLVSKEVVKEPVEFYNLISNYHMNAFAEGILTSCRFSNLYEIKDMKYVKDDRELASKEDYADIPEEYFYGLRLAEQPKEINRGNDDSHASSLKEHIMNVYVSNQKV